jgi:hypothetical protein
MINRKKESLIMLKLAVDKKDKEPKEITQTNLFDNAFN